MLMRDTARGSDEEPHLHALLEPRHRAAHRRGRDAGSGGGVGKALQFRRETEQFDTAEHQVVELPFIVSLDDPWIIHYVMYQTNSIWRYLSTRVAQV
jgi:hypothetical protein